mmetsp:Transcript_14627/g.21729  ORF Transcript_14627/g.21729 Transcript_14627/m.21729 type:complete len:102 (+) Transcript_14627:147-452(+)
MLVCLFQTCQNVLVGVPQEISVKSFLFTTLPSSSAFLDLLHRVEVDRTRPNNKTTTLQLWLPVPIRSHAVLWNHFHMWSSSSSSSSCCAGKTNAVAVVVVD